MRHARPLFLVAFLAILWGLGATYYARLQQQARNAPAKPTALPPGALGKAHHWKYTHVSNQKTVVTVEADDLQEVEGKQYLSGVTLDIQNKDGKEYDHVTSAKAEADLDAGMLYSDGEVEITMKVPLDQPAPAPGKLMKIKSSGITFETKTGKARTDRAASFEFDRGDGKAVGADYDPKTHELHLRSQIELIWRGEDRTAIPMKVEAGEVTYKEQESKVYLNGWSRLTRDTMVLNAGPAICRPTRVSMNVCKPRGPSRRNTSAKRCASACSSSIRPSSIVTCQANHSGAANRMRAAIPKAT